MIGAEFGRLPTYRLSYAIKDNLKNYYEVFKISNDKRNKGDLTPFILSFLEFVKSSLQDSIKNANELKKKLEIYRKRNRSLDLSETDKKVLTVLTENALLSLSGLTLSQLQKINGKGKSSVKRYLDHIEQKLGPDMIKIDTNHREYRYLLNLSALP